MLSEAYLFGGPVKLFRRDEKEWEDQVAPERYPAGCRLVGVAEMVHAISENKPHICSGEIAYHVLEVMLALEESSRKAKQILIKSRCEKPDAIPDGF